jgi:hypothetical protein
VSSTVRWILLGVAMVLFVLLVAARQSRKLDVASKCRCICLIDFAAILDVW